jgi:hypothetical protein
MTALKQAHGCSAGHLLRTTFQLLSKEDFEARTGTKAPAGKRYFQHRRLADIVGAYPLPEVRVINNLSWTCSTFIKVSVDLTYSLTIATL